MDKTTFDSAVDAVRASIDDAYKQGLERAWRVAQLVCIRTKDNLYTLGLNPYAPDYKPNDDDNVGRYEYSCDVITRLTIDAVLEKLGTAEIKPLPTAESVGKSFIKDVEAGLKKLDEATEQVKEETVCHCNCKSNADLIATILDCDSNNQDFRDNVCDNCAHKSEVGEMSACNACEHMSFWVKKSTTLPVGTIVVTTVGVDYVGCEVFPVGTIGRIVCVSTLTTCKLPYRVEAISPKEVEGCCYWYSEDTLRVVPESVLAELRTKEGT